MANTFLTPDFVFAAAQDAALLLSANLVAANLVSRQFEEKLKGVPTVGQTGGKIDVKVIAADTARTQNHRITPASLTVTNVTETSVEIDALHYVYLKKQINTKEGTYELEDFARTYTAPAMVGIANEIDSYLISKIAGGFMRHISGTAGTPASTVAHIIAGRKVLQDALVPASPRVGLIGTTAEASFLALVQFSNRDYAEDSQSAIKEAELSRRYGINWFVDQNVGTFDYGDEAGTVLSNGAVVAAASTVSMDAFTATAGTIKEGCRFKVSGDATLYTVTKDTDIASNAVSAMPFTPVVVTGWADDAGVTFQTAPTEDCIFHPGMVAGAIIAPRPLASMSAVAQFNGLSVRVTFESTTSDSTVGAADFVLYDVYVGGKVIRHQGGVILQGG